MPGKERTPERDHHDNYFLLGPVAAFLDIFRTPTPMWRTVSHWGRRNAREGNALQATTMHHLATRSLSNPRTIDERSPKRGMTQCLERGTPERDDASKPSRETIVSLFAFGEGSERFSSIDCVRGKCHDQKPRNERFGPIYVSNCSKSW
jgi:hypothetical protein